MKKLLAIIALCFALPASAANVKISDLPAASSVGGTNLFECSQSGTSRKCTATQIATFIHGLTSGDCTSTGPGVYTCTKTNGTSFSVLATTTPGTGVATAIAAALSASGGLTTTIAHGSAVLGTSAIASAACATVVTVSATNVTVNDTVTASFNSDPTAVTGYVPLTTGMLSIIIYPTANNVNVKVCNNTSASITPGNIELNWRVVR